MASPANLFRRTFTVVLAGLAAACASVPAPPIENQFSLVDPGKYKDEQQKLFARQLAVNDCKSKAMTASAAIEKSVASENHGMANQVRARDKAAEMYTTTFTTCMNNAGYIKS